MKLQPNALYNRYSSLNLSRLQSLRNTQSAPPVQRSKSPSVETQTDPPKPPPKPILKKESTNRSTTPTEKREVKIVETEPPAPKIENTSEPEKPLSPVKTIETHPSPVKTSPIRPTVIPKKGEKGLQRKWTTDQRRQMYLNKLSKKSLKRAEAEVNLVQEVLNDAEFDEKNIIQKEKELKGKLKIVNCAKLFLLEEKPISPKSDIEDAKEELPEDI